MGLGLKEGVPVRVEETVGRAVMEAVVLWDPVRLLVISAVPVPVPEAVTVIVLEGVWVPVPVWDLEAVWDPVPVGVCVLVVEPLLEPVWL